MNEDQQQSDLELVGAVQDGDFEAFRQIVLRYSNALLSVAYSVLGDFHEAQDVTQETFTKCYHQLHTLKDPTRLGSWLYSIAYRTSLDFAKKKKPTLPYEEANAQKIDHMDSWLEQHMIHDSIQGALNKLEEKSKIAIVLHYLSSWTMKEISQFLDLSVSAIESRIRRGRESLKLHLTDDFEAYFHPYRLGSDFEQRVSEQLLRRMGHFYIPVQDRFRTKQWFIQHFQLGVSLHDNLLLESGDELYLLQCPSHTSTDIPVLTFTVTDIEKLWLQLKDNGVIVEAIESNELLGKLFRFSDPDGNSYYAADNKI